MSKSYSSYSKQRKAIMQQVNRLEKRGYVVKERYHLPTVKELKTMTAKEQASVMRRAKSYTTEKVRQSARMPVYQPTKTGKAKKTTISYEKARKRERAASAKAGAETRRKRKKGTGTGGGDYRPLTEPPVKEPIPTSEEPESADEYGNIFDPETGEIIHEGKRETYADEQGNIFDVESGELLGNEEQRALYEEAIEQGDVTEGASFEDWLESIAKEPTGMDYINGASDFLDMQGETGVADLLREYAEKYQSYDPEGFESRLRGEDMPNLGDFYYEDSRGRVHYNVNAYVQLLETIKGKKLSASESRRVSKAIRDD